MTLAHLSALCHRAILTVPSTHDLPLVAAGRLYLGDHKEKAKVFSDCPSNSTNTAPTTLLESDDGRLWG